MDDAEIWEFGRQFRDFLTYVVNRAQETDGADSLVERITSFMGADPAGLQVVNEEFRPFEHATVQIAIDRLLAGPGVSHELIGVAGMARSHQSLSEILAMDRHSRMFSVGTVDYASVSVSVDEELTCVRFGIYLIAEGERRLVVLLRDQMDGPRGTTSMLEVLAASIDDARTWLANLREERVACNTLRGQVLSFEPSEFSPGAGPVRFVRRPELARDDVIMPAGLLERVERQVVGVREHRDRLLEEGRHLKRGVLLFGPPGTGKTHTVRYLAGTLHDFTVILLAGPAIRFVAEACALARTLQPSLIVLEDCDLVAEDRSFSSTGQPLLFTLLDEMDGLGADVDVSFLLTTNRVDLLETALAQRPGRVDLAVEIPMPDADGRRRLLDLYGRGIDVSEADATVLVERIEGVPASFVKELTRRATLLAAARESALTTYDDLHAAADELMAGQEALTRRLLGTSDGDDGWPDSGGEPSPDAGGAVAGPGVAGSAVTAGSSGWFAYGPTVARRHVRR